MTAHRLPGGGLIDRARPLSFSFDGRSFEGFSGDTLASALVANGVGLVGRSFKYHRPRGILTAGSEEPNALVELRSGARREPATTRPAPGMERRTVRSRCSAACCCSAICARTACMRLTICFLCW